MNRSNKIALGVIFVIFILGIGIYKFNTRLPDGETNTNKIMTMASNTLDTDVVLDAEVNPYQVALQRDEYRIYLYKNDRTNRYVFPVKEKKHGEIHFCYLVSYNSPQGMLSMAAVDINDPKWARFVDKNVAVIEGNNPYVKDMEYTTRYYYNHFSSLNIYDYIFY